MSAQLEFKLKNKSENNPLGPERGLPRQHIFGIWFRPNSGIIKPKKTKKIGQVSSWPVRNPYDKRILIC